MWPDLYIAVLKSDYGEGYGEFRVKSAEATEAHRRKGTLFGETINPINYLGLFSLYKSLCRNAMLNRRKIPDLYQNINTEYL